MENLKEKTAKGLAWGAFASVSTQVLSVAIGIVLGRLLMPEDYGIVGLLSIFINIAGTLSSSGFSNALINSEPTDNDYNSVFWFNITVSSFCYVLLFFSAPLIADFFHQPILVPLSRFLFICFILSASGMTYNAYLVKNMKNREMAIISLTSLIISSSVGITLAWLGKGVWSLAWQQVLYIAVVTVGRYWFVPWHPTLHFDFAPIRRMFPFSVNLLFTNIANTISQQILTVAFGRLFPVKAVGNYTQANKWSSMGSLTVSGTLQQIIQPVLVSVRGEQARECNVFRKMTRFTAFLSFPCLLGFAMVSHEFILVTIGEKWTECIPLLQILCIGGAFLPFYTLYQNLAISHGKSNLNLWLTIGQIALQMAIIFLLYTYGMQLMVIAFTCICILWLGVWHLFTYKLIELRFTDVLKDTIPFLLITAAVMTVAFYSTVFIENLWVLLLVRILVAALLYYAIMRLLNVTIFKECMRFLKTKKR